MAGDWLKVRASLRKDPHVLAMSDYLAVQRPFMDWLTDPIQQHCSSSAHEHVTRDVTASVTLASLINVWAMANEQGKPEEGDLVIEHCTLSSLDDIAGIPCFGAAMAHVDWAVERKDRRGRTAVVLPGFLKHNTPAGERTPTSAAERQRRYRERKASERDGNGDATRDAQSDITETSRVTSRVTPREEKRREERNTPPNPQGGRVHDFPPGFEEFWQAYPRKVGKDAAAKAFAKRKVNAALLAQMLQALERQRPNLDRRENGRFIPHPATWLNEGRWQDEPDAPGFGNEVAL